MVTGTLSGQRKHRLAGESADHRQLVLERCERRQRLGELEARSLDRRGPLVHDDPVGHVADEEPRHRPGRGVPHGRQGRHHPIEQRQGQRGPHSSQECPTRQRHLGDDHDAGPLLI